VLALLVALPMLTFLAMLSGVIGGGVGWAGGPAGAVRHASEPGP